MTRVLLIDDSPLALNIMRIPLENSGFEVSTALDGDGALAGFDAFRPDVVICDMEMPGRHGIEVVRELREREPLVPVLIVSEHFEASLVANAMREGAFRYLAKGVSDELLVQEVQAALNHRRLAQNKLRLEVENRAYQNDLEKLVEQKTEEIVRFEGVKARAEKMAALGTLIAGLAHEINNPLTAVKANVSWMEGLLPPVFEELAEALRPANGSTDDRRFEKLSALWAKKAATLATLPQAFSEVQLGISRVELLISTLRRIATPSGAVGACAIGPAMVQVEAIVRSQLGRAVLQHQVDPRLSTVRLPEDAFVTSVSNLILNAAKAMNGEAGRINVDIRLEDGGDTLISVQDTGQGIPTEHLAKVFEPFFTTRAPGDGMGLGLSLVYAIVSSAGGHVHIESELGKGTVVRVRLPMVSG